MRHRIQKKGFQRDSKQRISLIRGLVCSLVEHGRIKTTLAKAKELRRHVEKAVTIGSRGNTFSVRQNLLAKYPHKPTVLKLISKIGPEMKERPGGYTRIVNIGQRAGDNSKMALIEFVNYDPKEVTEISRKEKKKKEKFIARRKSVKKKSVREMKETSRKRSRIYN